MDHPPRRVASSAGVPDSWLNDAVKSYLSPRGEYDPYLELEHLRVFVAQPAYLLAMKCVAMRLGEELKPRMTLKLGRGSPTPLPDERTPAAHCFSRRESRGC